MLYYIFSLEYIAQHPFQVQPTLSVGPPASGVVQAAELSLVSVLALHCFSHFYWSCVVIRLKLVMGAVCIIQEQ